MERSPQPRRYLLLLVLASSGVGLLCWLYPELMGSAGMGPIDRWFLDTHTVLGAMEADWKGYDAYSYNAISGPHWYSHWWFWLGWAHPTQADTRWVGPLVSFSSYLAAWLVLRPRTLLELRWSLIVLCSAPLMLGFQRANADMLLFSLLVLCVPAMLSPHRFWRLAGAPLLIVLATGLKYYPATAGLILLAVRPPRDRNLALALCTGLLVLTAISVAPDLIHYTQNVPTSGFYTFGAPTLFLATGLDPGLAAPLTLAFLALTAWAVLQRSGLRAWSPPAALRGEYLGFILGAVILTGCFVTTVNYVYRWVFLVGMIPFLCRLAVARTHPGLHNLQKATRLLIALALWAEVPVVTMLNLIGFSQEVIDAWEDWTTGFLQLVTWALFACLSGWLAHFLSTQLRALRGAPLPESAES
jgi:hypothetical protein